MFQIQQKQISVIDCVKKQLIYKIIRSREDSFIRIEMYHSRAMGE